MVKLKVYVRVVPESAYGADAAVAAPRKFVVVVRDPTEWHIGTLAREALRSYQRLYRHELGKVKYLKDGDDNDLDPEQYVSDIFVNEGKAARDGLDQEAVIKLVQEQGHAVRADSVVPDLTPAHYSQPPPSRLPGQSSLGKRSHGAIGGLQEAGVVKRSKLDQIPESQDIMPSVEQSPELIHDTQQAGLEDDVFDDAKEYHLSHVADRVSATTDNLLPVTPSVNALPNGTATKSPVQQVSSASRFRIGNHRDVFAFPESDIEDSQMVNTQPEIVPRAIYSSQPTDQASSQAGPLPRAVTEFNAEEALYPMDLDKPISTSAVPQKPSNTSPRKKDVILNETNSSNSGNEGGDQESIEFKIPKTRRPTAAAKEKISSDSPERKRQKTPKLVNGTAQNERKQKQTVQRTTSLSNTKSRKQSQNDSMSKPGQSGPALTLSPSGRTSGVVSELDSPGEQLSQGLNASTKDQQLADGLQTSLAGKSKTKKQRLREERFEKNRSSSVSSSVSTSRPNSREGPLRGPVSKKTPKKKAQGNGQDDQQLQKQIHNEVFNSKTPARTEAAKSEKPTKIKSLQQKLADASAPSVAQPSEVSSDSRKEKQTTDSDGESGSDDEGAPLPSIENALIAPRKEASTLPLPNWGSNNPTNAAVRASPAFIMPVGMSEEEYRRLRAQNELTPQPPKITPASKRKASTPAATAKTPTSLTKEAVNKGKNIAGKATEQAKTVAKKAIAVESPSGEESSSSADESNSVANKKKGKADARSSSAKSSTKSASKSASPVQARKTQPAKPTKVNDLASMPPPTPKSTAKRRESMNKQQVERSSSSASTQETSSDPGSSKSSSSSSPAPTKTPAKTKPQANAPQSKKSTSTTNKQPTSAATASPAPATKALRPAIPNNRESALKLLRAKINSEAASPAPSSSSVTAKKKAAAITVSSSSSSSEEESSSSESSDDKESVRKQRSLGKAKINTPLRVVKPDPSIRDASPDESGSSDDDDE